MKKKSRQIVRAMFTSLPALLIIVYACNKSKDKQADTASLRTVILQANDTLENGLVLPIGTEISVHPEKPKTMHISFPGQYRFIGITVAKAAVQLQSFDITCTCTAGTEGCSPYTNPKASGCVTTGNCTTCTQKNSASIAGEDMALSEGAIVDLSQDIHFISNKAEVSAIPPAYASLFMDSTVLQRLRSFVTMNGAGEAFAVADTSSAGILPQGYVYPVSVFEDHYLYRYASQPSLLSHRWTLRRPQKWHRSKNWNNRWPLPADTVVPVPARVLAVVGTPTTFLS